MNIAIRNTATVLTVLLAFTAQAQQIKFDNLKDDYGKKIFGMHGGVSANAVFYNGDSRREPFTWIFSGNVNFNLFNLLDLPFSFNFNNLGGNYTYPSMPNRLSLHPSYKRITGHLGDVSMSFSPYTLNGHQFTGVGVELNPDKLPLKIAVMGGRLLKATEHNPEERLNMPAYQRMGYGAKVLYDHEKFSAGMNFFAAGDRKNSLKSLPDSLNVLPRSNVAMSWEAGFKLIKDLSLTAEYGISLLTRDIRAAEAEGSFFDKLFNRNPMTSVFHALRANLNYHFAKNTVGLGYERIDPNYSTLGAYYFTGDIENFTVNFSRPFFRDKLTLAMNAGLQHDNLDGNKPEETSGFVGSLNLNYNMNEHFNASFSYSNFQNYTNIKSQFDYINDITGYGNLDTLNFTQLSQSTGMNLNWNFGKSEARKHSVAFNVNYQEAADKHDNVIRTGDVSRFVNLAGNYGLLLEPQNLQLNASMNLSYSTVKGSRMLTYGPTLGASTKFFNKTLISGLAASYNTGIDAGIRQNSIFNIRWNFSYTLFKKHGLSLLLLNQSRKIIDRRAANDFTTTLSYSYSF